MANKFQETKELEYPQIRLGGVPAARQFPITDIPLPFDRLLQKKEMEKTRWNEASGAADVLTEALSKYVNAPSTFALSPDVIVGTDAFKKKASNLYNDYNKKLQDAFNNAPTPEAAKMAVSNLARELDADLKFGELGAITKMGALLAGHNKEMQEAKLGTGDSYRLSQRANQLYQIMESMSKDGELGPNTEYNLTPETIALIHNTDVLSPMSKEIDPWPRMLQSIASLQGDSSGNNSYYDAATGQVVLRFNNGTVETLTPSMENIERLIEHKKTYERVTEDRIEAVMQGLFSSSPEMQQYFGDNIAMANLRDKLKGVKTADDKSSTGIANNLWKHMVTTGKKYAWSKDIQDIGIMGGGGGSSGGGGGSSKVEKEPDPEYTVMAGGSGEVVSAFPDDPKAFLDEDKADIPFAARQLYSTFIKEELLKTLNNPGSKGIDIILQAINRTPADAHANTGDFAEIVNNTTYTANSNKIFTGNPYKPDGRIDATKVNKKRLAEFIAKINAGEITTTNYNQMLSEYVGENVTRSGVHFDYDVDIDELRDLFSLDNFPAYNPLGEGNSIYRENVRQVKNEPSIVLQPITKESKSTLSTAVTALLTHTANVKVLNDRGEVAESTDDIRNLKHITYFHMLNDHAYEIEGYAVLPTMDGEGNEVSKGTLIKGRVEVNDAGMGLQAKNALNKAVSQAVKTNGDLETQQIYHTMAVRDYINKYYSKGDATMIMSYLLPGMYYGRNSDKSRNLPLIIGKGHYADIEYDQETAGFIVNPINSTAKTILKESSESIKAAYQQDIDGYEIKLAELEKKKKSMVEDAYLQKKEALEKVIHFLNKNKDEYSSNGKVKLSYTAMSEYLLKIAMLHKNG